MLLKNAYVYRNDTHTFKKLDIIIRDGIIADIGIFTDVNENTLDLDGKSVIAGLIDVHTHGCVGYDFVDADDESLSKMARAYAKHGVTSVMPTVASAPFNRMLEATRIVNEHTPRCGESDLCGVHLEGRYLNPLRKGAHAPELISELRAEELENDAFQMCKSLCISAAFELDEDGSFAKKALEIGAVLGLGHTNASYEQAKLAESRGVNSYTHLFNAMPPLHHRDGGAACAALTGDKYAEIICDGIHICPQMIKMAYSMLGKDRTVLISDSMEATGCPDGEYSIAGNPACVKNGIALTSDGALAGSTLTLDTAVNNLIGFCGIPFEEAIPCATENPAKMIGVYSSRGSVDIGKRADIIINLGTKRLDIVNVMVDGRFVEN